MSEKGLYEKLMEYKENGKYPFHMPGHKRNERLFAQSKSLINGIDPYEIDITEIKDFDNLHHPEGIIKKSMDNAAKFFGTDKTWFLVNGSSCGLLSAIHAVTDIGDSIIIGRNCHKAIYNAIESRNLKTHYIYPQIIKKYGIYGGYKPEDVGKLLEQAAKQGEKIKAVVISSPTYEGIVSDIKSIAEIVHHYGSVLIVDEAHGAHFGIHENLPQPAYKLGADIVIESAHKTLPAMTQTAFLHLCEKRIEADKIQDALSIYQSSSPSYVLMASLDKCIRELQANGKEKTEQLLMTIEKFHTETDKLENIIVPGKELIGENGVFDFDSSKLIIYSNVNLLNGKNLEDILRDKYNFEIEMASAKYVLAMTTMCDDMEQILMLARALKEIDKDTSENIHLYNLENNILEQDRNKTTKVEDTEESGQKKTKIQNSEGVQSGFTTMSIYEAGISDAEEIMLKYAKGRISAQYIYIYPPEIPLIVPGEIISEKVIEELVDSKKMGLNVKGIEREKIKVLC